MWCIIEEDYQMLYQYHGNLRAMIMWFMAYVEPMKIDVKDVSSKNVSA